MSDACPICRAEVPDEVCPGCDALLFRGPGGLAPVSQDIRAGQVVLDLDFRRDPLPSHSSRVASVTGSTHFQPTDAGIDALVGAGKTVTCTEEHVRLRDLVLAMDVTVHSEHGTAGLVVRHAYVSDASAQYLFEVWPGRKQARFFRRVNLRDHARLVPLTDWLAAPVTASGQRDRLELRAQGSELQGYLNGELVCSVHDAVLGHGHVGMRASASGSKATERVSFHQLTLSMVTS